MEFYLKFSENKNFTFNYINTQLLLKDFLLGTAFFVNNY